MCVAFSFYDEEKKKRCHLKTNGVMSDRVNKKIFKRQKEILTIGSDEGFCHSLLQDQKGIHLIEIIFNH